MAIKLTTTRQAAAINVAHNTGNQCQCAAERWDHRCSNFKAECRKVLHPCLLTWRNTTRSDHSLVQRLFKHHNSCCNRFLRAVNQVCRWLTISIQPTARKPRQ